VSPMTKLPSLPLWGSAILALSLVHCAPRRIPGTEIDDTSDTREILTLMDKYRQAVEAKNADGVIALLDPSFDDDAGTSTPEDDVNYESIKQRLPEQFAQMEEVKLDLTVKKINLQRDGTALAVYSYASSYKLPKIAPKPVNDSDLDQMVLKRVDGKWKIVSGI